MKLIKITESVNKTVDHVEITETVIRQYYTDETYAELYSASSFESEIRDRQTNNEEYWV